MSRTTFNKKKFPILLTISIMALMITATSAVGVSPLFSKVMAQSPQKFTANLTGGAEVPPVDTKASGDATFELNAQGTNMSYVVNVNDLDKILYTHIHQGVESENGPIVVTLFNPSDPTGKINGQLVNGTFASSNLEGPLKGKQMSDLQDIINNKSAYVNVHTEQNPPGELRGTIQ